MDLDLYLSSRKEVNKMIKRYDVSELSNEEVEEVSLEENVISVYRNDDEEVPFVGCVYDDGKCSVVGVRVDKFCSFGEMFRMVSGK